MAVKESGVDVHLICGERSKPVPPPRPVERGEWENEWLTERAAGVAVFSGRIHVSVSARASREAWDANAGMKSALFTADWQFQSPIERERAGGEDLEK